MADHIFISYSHDDSDYAHRLAVALEEEGFIAWVDARIDYGTQWPRVIEEHLDTCSAFVVIMTPKARESEWVASELTHAKDIGKPIYPLLLEGERAWLEVKVRQYVDVRGARLPPPRFYKQLAEEAPRRESHKKPSKTYTNSIGMEFVLVPAGTFQMGSDIGRDEEEPVHGVTISKPFYLGKYPVTQEQWKAVMGNNPSHFKGDQRPVENVSWDDAQTFVGALNEEMERNCYRLPTDAEWEYACRAGTTTVYSFGNDPEMLGEYAWYATNSGNETHPVGQKKPNPWGLYDMHGNVSEWVHDWFSQYSKGEQTDPSGPQHGGEFRVVRGGGWYYGIGGARSANRSGLNPVIRSSRCGFRVVRTVPCRATP